MTKNHDRPRRTGQVVAALSLVMAIHCQPGAGPSDPALSVTPPPVATQPAPAPATSATPPPERPHEACAPGQSISPATLAATWPDRIGQRVRMRTRVELSVDLMTAVVTAGGRRFAVVVGPDRLWKGVKDRSFTVMGATTVSLGGKVTMPQLLLEEECAS